MFSVNYKKPKVLAVNSVRCDPYTFETNISDWGGQQILSEEFILTFMIYEMKYHDRGALKCLASP